MYPRLLSRLLRQRSSLAQGVSFLAFTAVSVPLIYSGLPIKVAMELGIAAGVGAGALMTFIDTLVGISESVERRQEDREWVRLEDDVRGGRLSIVQALHIVVRIQLKKELRSVPWYQFAERRRLKESAKNRRLAIDQVLACTSLQASGLSFKQTCEALYEVERIVVQMSASGQPLPSGQGAIELAEGVFRQVRALSPPVSKEMPFPVEMPSRAVPVVEVRP